MQVIQEEVPLTEHFSFAEITWKIKNISPVLCPLKQEIFSEEFQITGREDTLWRMCLSISHERNVASLYLRMMGPDEKFYCLKDQQAGLKVNCFANILDSNGEQPLKFERTFYFNYRDNKEIETFELADILRNLPHIGPDDLTIRCHILVDHGERVDVPADVPYGLTELSATMANLIKNPLFPDIHVFVNNKIFFLNKDMFSNIKGLGKFMDPKYKEAKLLNYCEYSLYSIFMYAYSGNINHIIGAPRIRVAEDIERLDVPDLFGAYPKERIPLESTVEVKESTCVWEIKDLERNEEPLNGPEFSVDRTNTRWKVCMHPKGKINGNDQERKYVFLEATLLESIRTSIDANIEFRSVGKNGSIFSRRDHRRMNVGDKLEVPFFRRGGLLMKKCLIDGDLKLRITLWISTGQINTSIGFVANPRRFTQTNTISLTFFSRKMRNIFAESQTWDLGLACGEISYRAHKFVLASRCPYFKNRMSYAYRPVLVLPNFKQHFIRMFLEHLYTGLYCDMEFEADCHLYEFGFFFEIDYLKARCRQELNYDNLLKVFECAHDNKLQNLGKETYQHLVNIGAEITNHPGWNDFFNRRTNLACAIVSSWR